MICEIIPKPGRIKIYTSGCPKNQNKCWNRIGSPPPFGLKKEVLKFRSLNSMVIPPARTGRARINKKVVIKILQQNKEVNSIINDFCRITKIDEIKFRDLIIEEIPAIWRDRMVKSTEDPKWYSEEDKGGYIVHPVPDPLEDSIDCIRIKIEQKINQKDMLFIRGKAISQDINSIGISQFPNPPIIAGMTIKKIIIKAWAVITELYTWSFMMNEEGILNSKRIILLKDIPIIADHILKIK